MTFEFPKPTRTINFLLDSDKKITVSRGGTRSGKTYGACMVAAAWLLSGQYFNGKVWSIVRETLPALKSSAYRDFLEILNKSGGWKYVQHNKSDLTFSYGGRMVEFFSLDDVNKVKSRKRDICHIVECNEISYDMFTQLMIRTKEKMILDFNPNDFSVWMKSEIEDKRMPLKGDVDLLVSTYKDNPHLTKPEIENIEYLAQVDPDLWQVFGLGEYGQVKDIIFPKWTETPFPEDCDYVYVGIDFGFSFDPASVTLVGKSGNNIYLKELIYETGLLNLDIYNQIVELGCDNISMVADSAEPKSIAELNSYGLEVARAVKGADSIRSGISLMKTYKIHIDPMSVNIKKEFNVYKWSSKKAGTPVDRYNHSIDGIRYVITKHFKRDSGFSTMSM
jgi:phage terminase large subunit